jgi:DNA-binding CsgD family transcriptional regulator
MINRLELDVSTAEHDGSTPYRIIGEFNVESNRYLILLLVGIQKSDLEIRLNIFHSGNPGLECLEIARFEINGQNCAIVQTEDTLPKDELDFATLLTERELQIAVLVASGHPNKQIAKQLHISEWTVATYLRRIFVKLSVNSRAAMVYRCAPLIQRVCDLEATTTD